MIDTRCIDAPAELRDRRSWLVWRWEQRPGQDKPTKPPYIAGPGLTHAKISDPSTWRPFEEAAAHLDAFDGLGLVLGADPDGAHDNLGGADLDDCRDPRTGVIEPWARDIIERMDSYSEISPSGTGIKVFFFGELPSDAKHRKPMPGGGHIELYDRDRYFTVTGAHLEGTPRTVEQRTAELTALHRELFDASDRDEPPAPDVTTSKPRPRTLHDDALLQVAFASRNGNNILALWGGDDLDYPSTSEADAALACHLAFYARDPAHLEGLMMQSSRVREKWHSRRGSKTWIARECEAATAKVIERYSGVPVIEGLVRIDRALLDLDDGPLMTAALIAAGVDEDASIANLCDVTERTVGDWRKKIIAAGLEEQVRTRPTKRFVLVSRKQLTHPGATVAQRVTGIHLAACADAWSGIAQVSGEALADRRGRARETVSGHVNALATAGLVRIIRSPWNAAEETRECNVYLLLDTIAALERCAEAREEDSLRETSHSDDVKPHKNQCTHGRGGKGRCRSARASTQEGPCEAGLGSEGGETSLSLPSSPLDEPRRRLTGSELNALTERIASIIEAGDDEEAQRLLDLWRRETKANFDGEVPS
jgi:putative DNA primase/helicase